jgi:hypothetical protein
VRVEVAAAGGSRDAHDQQRHLLVLFEQAAALPVAQRLFAQRAGIDLADGVQQFFQALLARTVVDAENALVLPGEGVAVLVFKPRTGADDERPLAEVIEHPFELAQRRFGEGAAHDARARFVQPVQEGVRITLAAAHPPHAVAHEEGVEDLGADVEGIVRFELVVQLGRLPAQDAARHQHAERLAADAAGADHPVAD